jgi:ubiquinone/menaquinone biosynthesis C-methylase UbiE
MQGIQELYSERAPRYDITSKLYYLIGVRMNAYRKHAVQALQLARGSTVLELGCGTGLNFPLLQQAVGPEGRIIGVDLTPAMLEQASTRIRDHGWDNVELIQADASQLRLPQAVDGVLSTFALSIMPAYEEIIRKSAAALKIGGRLVLLDLKLTAGRLRFLNPLGVLITRPFGGTYEAGRRRSWEVMREHLTDVWVKEYYFGFVYIASGTRAEQL